MKKVSVLIPAYNPTEDLLCLIDKLNHIETSGIIVVNDGSDLKYSPIFNKIKTEYPKIILLEHAVNLGKGAALKTGLNYIFNHFAQDIGTVTADADGQHLVEDIIRVGEKLLQQPQDLIIGTREFSNHKKIPLRSQLGNLLTIKLFKLIVGQSVADTQSGLRGIPHTFIPALLTIHNNGYEFELNMLIACKYLNRKITEVPIMTVYIDHNKSSHFNPIIDSLKIYFVLFRFMLLSLLTTTLDFTVFSLLSFQGVSILDCQLAARVLSVLFNYPLAKKIVFHFEGGNSYPFFKYIILVLINFIISFSIINYCVSHFNMAPVIAKVMVESTLFLANFAIQRDFIFTKKIAYGA